MRRRDWWCIKPCYKVGFYCRVQSAVECKQNKIYKKWIISIIALEPWKWFSAPYSWVFLVCASAFVVDLAILIFLHENHLSRVIDPFLHLLQPLNAVLYDHQSITQESVQELPPSGHYSRFHWSLAVDQPWPTPHTTPGNALTSPSCTTHEFTRSDGKRDSRRTPSTNYRSNNDTVRGISARS